MGPDQRAVLAHIPLVQLVRVHCAGQQALEVLGAGLAVVGVGDVQVGARRQLREAVAEEVTEPLVEAQPAPLWAHESDANDRAFERRL